MMLASRARRPGLAIGLAMALALCAGEAGAGGVSPAKASAEEKERAQLLYDRGAELYEVKRFEQARAAFRASHDIVASPASRFMVACTLRDQLQIAAAYEEFERAEDEAKQLGTDPRYLKIADESSAERRALERFVARITVNVKGGEGGKIQIGRRELPPERWGRPFPVTAGANPILGTAAGGHRAIRWVTVKPGDDAVVELDLFPPGSRPVEPAAAPAAAATRPEAKPEPPPAKAAPPASPPAAGAPARLDPIARVTPQAAPGRGAPESESHSRVTGYVIASAGLGVAGMAVFGVAGAMNLATHARLDEACPGGACPRSALSDVDAGRSQQLVANIGLFVGVVGLGTAFALVVLDPGAPRTSAAATPSLAVGVGPGSLRMTGSF